MARRVFPPVQRPFCSPCAKLMLLSRIDIDEETEQRVYRCPSCGKTVPVENQSSDRRSP